MRKVLIVICLFWSGKVIQAQETLTSSGGNALGSGGTVSYTVGQIAYVSSTSTSGNIIQGVQQPYDIIAVTGIEGATDKSLELSVFPNPTTGLLTLKVRNYTMESFKYKLRDINGSIIQSGDIVEEETLILLKDLAPAAYYLTISNIHKQLKTFKIIKNH